MKKACLLLILVLSLTAFMGCVAVPPSDADLLERVTALEEFVYRMPSEGDDGNLADENSALRMEMLELHAEISELKAQIAQLEANPPNYFDTYNRYQMEKNIFATVGATEVVCYLAGLDEKDGEYVVSVDPCEIMDTGDKITVSNESTKITKYPLGITSYYGITASCFGYEQMDVKDLLKLLEKEEPTIFTLTVYDGKVCMMVEYRR